MAFHDSELHNPVCKGSETGSRTEKGYNSYYRSLQITANFTCQGQVAKLVLYVDDMNTGMLKCLIYKIYILKDYLNNEF